MVALDCPAVIADEVYQIKQKLFIYIFNYTCGNYYTTRVIYAENKTLNRKKQL